MEKPKLVCQKNVEKTTNKIRLPKKIVEKLGYEYYMVYNEDENNIILIPKRKEK